MKIVINAWSAAGPKTGVGHYVSELLRCLRAQAAGDEIRPFPSPWFFRTKALWQWFRPLLRETTAEQVAAESLEAPPAPTWRGRFVRRMREWGRDLLTANLNALLSRTTCDVYHEPNFIPLPSDRPTVTTLHDLSAVLHPEWHPADRVAHFEKHFRAGLAQSCHFLAISEFGRQEVIRTLGLRPEQVTRTYMGVRPGLGPLPPAKVLPVLKRLGLPPNYLLYLGTLEPRKNVLTLLRAYVALPAAVRERCPLVLAGGWGWNAGDVAAFLDAEGKARGVRHVGYLPEGHMPAVYNGARALVFPTFYEGFGLPPMEMLACGGAVLCSTAGALVETVGKQAHLVEPLDVDGWRDALHRVVSDDDWHAELRRGATDVARPFTWEQCAADTLTAYRVACGAASPADADPLRQAG
jgi:glycosyltransferase involved in cell wall biosynthesis